MKIFNLETSIVKAFALVQPQIAHVLKETNIDFKALAEKMEMPQSEIDYNFKNMKWSAEDLFHLLEYVDQMLTQRLENEINSTKVKQKS